MDKKSRTLFVICVSMAFVLGFGGALMASGLLGGMDNNFPSVGAAAETVDGIGMVVQQAWSGVVEWAKGVVVSPAFRIAASMVGMTAFIAFLVVLGGRAVAGAARSTVKHPKHAAGRQKAYAGNTVRVE